MKRSYFQAYNKVISNYSRSIQYLRAENKDFDLTINKVFRELEITIFRALEKNLEEFSRKSAYRQDITIRPDAIHFIILNFHQLVILPIFEEASIEGKLESKEFEQIFEFVLEDLNLIVESAIQLTVEKQTNEVSSHMVIEALHLNWSNLKSSKVEIWG